MHVHEHIWAGVTNQQVVIQQRLARSPQIGVHQLSQVWWQIKHYDSFAPLARILVMGQLDAHQQRGLAHDVQPVALTAGLLAVKMWLRCSALHM